MNADDEDDAVDVGSSSAAVTGMTETVGTIGRITKAPLGEYLAGDLVYARATGRKNEPYWPGAVLEPRDAPAAVRRECAPETVCVMFFGPSASKGRDRDYAWANAEMLAPYAVNREVLDLQRVAKRLRPTAFREACVEAGECFREAGGSARLGAGAFAAAGNDEDGGAAASASAVDVSVAIGLPCSVVDRGPPKCSSCGVADETVSTKSGRCALCAKLHKEGQYCPVCDRVWHWSAGDPMVGCDKCEMWIHRECDAAAADVLDREEKYGEEVAYSCPSCRSKTPAQVAAEKRQAEEARVEAARKEEQRERKRLEKLLSKPRVGRPSKAIKEARLMLKKMPVKSPTIKSPHAATKKQNTIPKRPKSSWQLFSADFFSEYKESHGEDNIDFAEVYRSQGAAWRDLDANERERYEERAREEANNFRDMILEMSANGELDEQQSKRYDKIIHPESYEKEVKVRTPRNADESKASRRSKAGAMSTLPDGSAMPERLSVICNGVAAEYLTQTNQVLCHCSDCGGQASLMSPTEFEKHAGMGQAKKWKTSLRMVEPAKMPIGRFLDGKEVSSRSKKDGGIEEEEKVSNKPVDYELVHVSWSVDRCAVCDDERDFDFDQLITCEACAVTVHQSCYGVPDVPDDTVGWLCRACEHTGGAVSETPLCCLCPVGGGALKPTTIPSLWAHSACCQWIPETTVLDIERMEPIDNIANIQKERWSLLCTVCKQRMGAKIQCCHPGCYLAYHPLCARATGLYLDANDDGDDDESPLQLLSYCHRHCRVDSDRAQIYAGTEGLRIGEEGRLLECGANKQRQPSKSARRKAEEERERREALEAQGIDEESELSSDSEYDITKCAKFRQYAPVGHPRTEADIKDENDDDTPGSTVKHRVRKRVLHASDDEDDDDDDGEDDVDEEEADDATEPSYTASATEVAATPKKHEVTSTVDDEASKRDMDDSQDDDDMEIDDDELSMDMDDVYDPTPTDDEGAEDDATDSAVDVNLPGRQLANDDSASPPDAKKQKLLDNQSSESSPNSITFGLPGKPAPATTGAKYAALPGGLPVPEGNVPRPELPEVQVRCASFKGIFRPADTFIRCLCSKCSRDADTANQDAPALWEANRWEAHAGMRHTKKWKISIKVQSADGGKSDKTLGEWLDENDVTVLVSSNKGAARSQAAVGLPGRKPKRPRPTGSRGRLALLGLGLGTFENDQFEDKSGEEAKARALLDRRVQVDLGTLAAPQWKDGTMVDVTITRTGIRYKIVFDDGTDQIMSFTRDALNLRFIDDGESPDLSFLPEPVKGAQTNNTHLETQIAVANAEFPSAKRPANQADRAKIAKLAKPKKPREKEAWVQCENASCGKWRRVPQSFAEKFSADDADMWTCQKNPDATYSVCSVPQEFEDDEIDRRIALGDDAPYMDGSDDESDGGNDKPFRTYRPEDLPEKVSVVCRGVPGTYHVEAKKIQCLCRKCIAKDEPVFFECNKYEAHCGNKASKKWKQVIRVILSNRTLITLGKWLEIWGCEIYREKVLNPLDKGFVHHRKLSRKQLEEIQANVYKRLGFNKNDKNAKMTGPPPKTGKRLFVGLTPYIVRGTRGAFKRDLIASKKYTPSEFAALQADRKARGVAAVNGDKTIEQQGMTMREKLEHMTSTYSDRLTFAKSNIHGWGLLAKVAHKAGSMVTQFKGETCRSTVADLREARYEESGVDCYLLKQDDDTVVDCTFRGNFARFTNHSCNPNMYSKIVKVDDENHIIFFARNDVKAGEELTYNYRFESEDGKVPCYCGAYNCRGYLC